MENKILIDSVNNLKVALNEISVYEFDVYTSMELYYKIAENFNKVIKELNRFEGVVSDEVIKQNEKLLYLLGEGLKIEVVDKINEMVEKGVFDTIINHNIFNNLKNDINSKFKGNVNIEEFKTYVVKKDVNGIQVDDWTLAFKEALNYCFANNLNLNAIGTYNISDSLHIRCNLTGYPNLNYIGDNLDKCVVKVGVLDSKEDSNLTISIGDITNKYGDRTWHGWINNSFCGVEINKIHSSDIYINSIQNFTVGCLFNTKNFGVYYNNFTIKKILNCKIGYEFALYDNGNINANNFYDTNYATTATDEYLNANVDRYFIKQKRLNDNINGMDSNNFYNFKAEIYSSFTKGTVTLIDIYSFRNNTFYGFRNEMHNDKSLIPCSLLNIDFIIGYISQINFIDYRDYGTFKNITFKNINSKDKRIKRDLTDVCNLFSMDKRLLYYKEDITKDHKLTRGENNSTGLVKGCSFLKLTSNSIEEHDPTHYLNDMSFLDRGLSFGTTNYTILVKNPTLYSTFILKANSRAEVNYKLWDKDKNVIEITNDTINNYVLGGVSSVGNNVIRPIDQNTPTGITIINKDVCYISFQLTAWIRTVSIEQVFPYDKLNYLLDYSNIVSTTCEFTQDKNYILNEYVSTTKPTKVNHTRTAFNVGDIVYNFDLNSGTLGWQYTYDNGVYSWNDLPRI